MEAASSFESPLFNVRRTETNHDAVHIQNKVSGTWIFNKKEIFCSKYNISVTVATNNKGHDQETNSDSQKHMLTMQSKKNFCNFL